MKNLPFDINLGINPEILRSFLAQNDMFLEMSTEPKAEVEAKKKAAQSKAGQPEFVLS